MTRVIATIFITASSAIAIALASPQVASPARDVLQHFCELDAQGAQLTKEGWQRVAALFVSPGEPQHARITVVRDYVVSLPSADTGRAAFYVEYIELGRIDTATAQFSALPSMKQRANFFVVEQPALGRNGSKAGQGGGGSEWRIEGPVPEPRLTVDGAIRYAERLRVTTKDPAMKKNADRTMATLKRLR